MKLSAVQRQISKLLEQKRFTLASSVCLDWIPTAVDGLMYYHRYERTFLTIFVILTFLFWQLFVWNLICQSSKSSDIPSFTVGNFKNDRKYLIAAGLIVFYLFTTYQPLFYYIYCLLPICLLYLNKNSSIFTWLWSIFESCSTFFSCLLTVAAVEILVLSFFYRWALAIGLLLIAVWPSFKPYCNGTTKLVWALVCCVNAVFPLLPTVGQSVSYAMVSSASFVIGAALYAATSFRTFKSNGGEFKKTFLLNLISVVSICCSFVVLLTSVSVDAKCGSPLIARIFSWICLISSPILPLLADKTIKNRSLTLILAFFCPFCLMSVSYEPYFLISFSILLYLWLDIEQKNEVGSDRLKEDNVEFGSDTALITRNIQFDDVRRAYFFVFFILLAFFGTGNIASLNSFNPSFIYCFVTVFSPFLMMVLLMVKIVIPFLFVCTALYALESMCTMSCTTGSLFWLIVMISDFMALVSFHIFHYRVQYIP